MDMNSLSHTTWNCKYHIVFAPKYRRKEFYGTNRLEIGKILRELCKWKEVNIITAEVCPDHVHMFVEIPPKLSVSSFMGFLKGENDLSLRFDLTVPLAKYVAMKQNELVFPFKRYQIGKVFRGERPQKGRFREFYQCDIDVIGKENLSLRYDAEMPSIIIDIFKKLNFGKFKIKINNRKILNGFFEELKLQDISVDILRIIDKIEKIGLINFKEELKLINVQDFQIEKILEFINITGTNEEIITKLRNLNIENETFKLGLEELENVIKSMKDMEINEEYFQIDLTIARGLDYYTGIVYETILTDYPTIGSVCSGGRFDNLAEYYTDTKLPGVGISIGLTRLFYKLKEAGILTDDIKSLTDVLIISLVDDYKYVYKVADILRRKKRVNICYLEKGLKQQMKYANKLNSKYTILIGEDELKNEEVTIKDMNDNKQEKVKILNLDKYFN